MKYITLKKKIKKNNIKLLIYSMIVPKHNWTETINDYTYNNQLVID